MTFLPRRSPSGDPLIMGILNVTPDSFSDGGLWTDVDVAVSHALDMVDQGASIIDVGAESTRPGSSPVSADEEMRRLRPVLEALLPVVDVPVSVDTMKTEVAEMCVAMGADIVNDVNGLRAPGMAELCASAGVCAIIMHMPVPEDMGAVHSSEMGDGFAEDIRGELRSLTESAVERGMDRDMIVLDPGIGFGKTPEQNMWLLSHSSLSASSRKRFLSVMYPGMDRDEASARAALVATESGADIVRVHNVAATAEMLRGLSRRSDRQRR